MHDDCCIFNKDIMNYKDWIKLRDNSIDERNDKLCYCGHTYKCSCANPDEQLYKECVMHGTIIPDDPENGWSKNKLNK